MATIESLHTSISVLPSDDLFNLLRTIRNNRLRRPEKKIRETKAPAKTKRKPSASAPKQQDLFALVSTMSPEQKAALAAKLMKR